MNRSHFSIPAAIDHLQLHLPSRRHFLGSMTAILAASYATPGLYAELLKPTARTTEGPFYPDHLPLDTDNDLLVLNDSITPALGQITHLSGKILDIKGEPVRNAFIEIWQVDAKGAYIHSQSAGRSEHDSNFQGYGRFLTNSKGEYYFRTIKPVPYPGRTPHIHVAVSRNGQRLLTTQILFNGEKQNERDGVFNGIRDPEARKSILADYQAIPNSKLNELAVNWDCVIGKTAQEDDEGNMRGVAKSELSSGRGGRGPGGPGGPNGGPPPRERPQMNE
jgi:protocatechuate 3,4-dioxygenase beta subunit